MQIGFLVIVLQFDLAQLLLELRLADFKLFPQFHNTLTQLADLALGVFPFFQPRAFEFFAQGQDCLLKVPQFKVVFHAGYIIQGTKN